MSFNPFNAFDPFGSGGYVPFNPLSLSPALWLSDTGSDASVWTDLSGNGRHVTQASPSNQPSIISTGLNGRQTRRFVGNHWLNGPISQLQPYTVIAVASSTDPTITQDIIHGSPNSTTLTSIGYHTSKAFIYGGGLFTAGTPGTTPRVLTYELSGGYGSIRIDGITAGSGPVGTRGLTSLSIGRNSVAFSEYWRGDLAEILIFGSVLSAGNRQNVEQYLSSKYAIALA